MKIKVFVQKGDAIEDCVNDWLSQHPNVKVLHQFLRNNWVNHVDVHQQVVTNMITMIIEYEEKNDN